MSEYKPRFTTVVLTLEVTYDDKQWEPPETWDWFEAIADGYAVPPNPEHLKFRVIGHEYPEE